MQKHGKSNGSSAHFCPDFSLFQPGFYIAWPHLERTRDKYLNRFVIFGERHLRHLIAEFMRHYLDERYHQGIGSRIVRPRPSPDNDNAMGPLIGCRSSLGGLLNYYFRQAA